MKLQFERTKDDLWDAMYKRIRQALKGVEFDHLHGSDIVALDSDFLHTTNVNDARWLFSDSYYAAVIIRISADGSMVKLEKK
jgi:hypothetical protein